MRTSRPAPAHPRSNGSKPIWPRRRSPACSPCGPGRGSTPTPTPSSTRPTRSSRSGPTSTPPANQAPVAVPGGPYSGADTIHFDGSASYDPDSATPLSYAWSFGDSSSGNGPAPVHVYRAPGSYTVTLTVTDTLGASSAPASTSVTVSGPANQAPVAVPGGPYAGVDTIRFDGGRSSDPDSNLPLTFAWTFGDASGGRGARPLHVYRAAGSYTVALTVTDARGATSPAATTTARIQGR